VINYIDMLKLRIKYCDTRMPIYANLDKDLVKKKE